jgi:hypothetical protein
LEILEKYQKAERSYDHGNIWSVSIDLLKSFDFLTDVFKMIEEGDQGISLRNRVKAIREDEEGMSKLNAIWLDKGWYMDYGFGTDDEEEDDEDNHVLPDRSYPVDRWRPIANEPEPGFAYRYLPAIFPLPANHYFI